MSADIPRIRILAVDDHTVVRQRLAGLVAMQPDLTPVGEGCLLFDEVITLLAQGDQLLDHLTGGSHHALVGSALDWYSTPDQRLMGESPFRSLAVIMSPASATPVAIARSDPRVTSNVIVRCAGWDP